MKTQPWIFSTILVILAVMLIICLIRAILGPTISDRVVAVNMMGTMVMVIIAVLALRMNEGYLVDICLIYAMISFLAVVVLTKIYTGVYLERKDRGEKLKNLELEDELEELQNPSGNERAQQRSAKKNRTGRRGKKGA